MIAILECRSDGYPVSADRDSTLRRHPAIAIEDRS